MLIVVFDAKPVIYKNVIFTNNCEKRYSPISKEANVEMGGLWSPHSRCRAVEAVNKQGGAPTWETKTRGYHDPESL